jgi:hypothetical protein
MVFKLVDGAQKHWRKPEGHNQLPKIIQGVKFISSVSGAVELTSISLSACVTRSVGRDTSQSLDISTVGKFRSANLASAASLLRAPSLLWMGRRFPSAGAGGSCRIDDVDRSSRC